MTQWNSNARQSNQNHKGKFQRQSQRRSRYTVNSIQFYRMKGGGGSVIALASWGSGGAVRSPGQSLRGCPVIGAHRSSENPGVSSSKNGLRNGNCAKITLVIVWKIYHGAKKNLMFFFSTSVACMINRTLRKHNTNEVNDSGIFLQTYQYFVVIPLFIRVYETVIRNDV